jgi:hypothetical protein
MVLTVHQCLSESHPLCSSRKDRIARPPDQVVLPQSMRRVVHQYTKILSETREIIHTRMKSVLASSGGDGDAMSPGHPRTEQACGTDRVLRSRRRR